jgi:autotransporter-associated beta strand protein
MLSRLVGQLRPSTSLPIAVLIGAPRLASVGAIAVAFASIALPSAVWANCVTVGLTVTCDSTAPNPWTTTIGTGPSTAAGTTVSIGAGSQVVVGDANAISLANSASITVGGLVQNTARVSGGLFGVGPNTIEFNNNGTLTVQAGGTVYASGGNPFAEAVNVIGRGSTIDNFGTIRSDRTIPIFWQAGNGTLINEVGGVIQGPSATATAMGAFGGGVNVTNKGMVIGNLLFNGSNNQLHIFAGSTITGTIDGGSGINNLMTLNGTGSGTMFGALTDWQTLIKQDSGTWTLTGSLGNNGGASPLTVEVQAGTLVLSGDNASFNGTMTVDSGGTLQGTSGTLTPLIANNGVVDFAQTSDGAYGGTIFGAGAVVKNGTGTLTLTGANSYSGGTVLNAGTIAVGADNNLGAPTGPLTFNGGTLQFTSSFNLSASRPITLNAAGGTIDTQDFTTTIAQGITGAGALTKAGVGTLTLSGVNTFTGGTTVNGGALMVTGSLASGVTVNDGGLLGGGGTVGGATINSGGTIQPGPGFSALNVMGTYTQNAGSTYAVVVNPAGQSNLINVNGSALLNGGTVSAHFAPGEYANNTRFTILSATGGVSGTFSGLGTNNFAFLSPSLVYDPNNVFLNLTFNGFESGAHTPDEHAVARALDVVAHTATGDLGVVIGDLEELSATEGAAALDAISGQPYADLATVRIQVARAFMNTISAQTAASRSSLGAASDARTSLAQVCDVACDTAEPARWGAWLSGVGGAGSVPSDANASTLTYNFGGAAVGLDYRINPQFLVGIGLGYVTGTQWVNGFAGQAMTNAVSGSLYASFTQGPFYLDGSAGYAHFVDWMTRTIAIPGLSTRNAQGQVSADQFLGQLETGYRIPLPTAAPFAVAPFLRLQGSTTNQAGLTETGGNSLDLIIAPQTTNSLRSTLGAELAAAFGSEHKVAANFRLGWQHEFAGTGRNMSAAFAGAPGDAFTVFGATPQRDSAAIGFSLRALVSDATEFYARYDGEVGGGTDNHAITAGLRVRW